MDSFPHCTADIPLHLFAKFMRAFVLTSSPPFNLFRQISVNYISLYVDSWAHCMSVDLRPLVIARSIDFHVELPNPLQVLCRPSAHWDHMSRKCHLRDITFSVSPDFGPIITFTISNEIGELWTRYGYEAVEKAKDGPYLCCLMDCQVRLTFSI